MVPHSILARLCLESYHQQTFSVDDIEVLILPVNGCNVVVVRGTELNEPKDLLRGLLGFIGYQNAAQKVFREVLARLDYTKNTILTGHSAGGCIAIYLNQILQADEVVTFGAPRISAVPGATCTSYVYGNDAIPKLFYPLCWTSGKKVRLAKNKQKWYKFSIKDHLLQGYIDELAARA